MSIMKNTIFIRIWVLSLALFAFAFTACDEFPPVSYDDPQIHKVYTDEDFPGVIFTSIADLKAMYTNTPVDFGPGVWVKAQIVTSDREGNFYRSMYIQDETGAIELKMGTRNLYNEYKMGQWIYVHCTDLTIGNYGGMIQLGYKSATSQYETAYIDVQYIIDTHIFKGAEDTIEPILITSKEITDSDYYGRYVTIKGLTYGNRVFTILYDDDDNSTYLNKTNGNYGITTWAIDENGFARYMARDRFGGALSESEAKNYSPSCYNVSQYFYTSDNVALQVRTSGYSRFADTEIDPAIIDGALTDFTGILTYYSSNNQFVLNDLDGVVME